MVVRDNLRLFAQALREDKLPDPAGLTWLAESAARRAEEGVPLEMVLQT